MDLFIDRLIAVLLLCFLVALPPLLWWLPTRLKAAIFLPLILLGFAATAIFNPEAGVAQAIDLFSMAILLFILFFIAETMELRFRFRGRPEINTLYLLFAALLANAIGAVAASILLIRPLIRANARRSRAMHIGLFFIIIVANSGPMLFPLATLHHYHFQLSGVPPLWYAHLFAPWSLLMLILLTIFYLIDRQIASRDGIPPDSAQRLASLLQRGIIAEKIPQKLLFRTVQLLEAPSVEVRSLWKVWFLVTAALVVWFSGYLASPFPWRELALFVLLVVLVLATDRETLRRRNFSIGPYLTFVIYYGVVLFLSLPLPPLLHYTGFGLEDLDLPLQILLTGVASAFLDGTLVSQPLLSATLDPSIEAGIPSPLLLYGLIAIGLAGAISYSGNILNLYLRQISSEEGIRLPGYFTYLWWSGLIVLPLLIFLALLLTQL